MIAKIVFMGLSAGWQVEIVLQLVDDEKKVVGFETFIIDVDVI